MNSIPNSIKEALLQVGLGHVALLLDLVAFMGLDMSKPMDFATIQGMASLQGIAIDGQLIRRGLRELVTYKLCSVRLIRLKTNGRPAFEYHIASMAAIARALGIELKHVENYDSPGIDGFKSLKAYRMGLYYTYIQKRPGRYSRKFLGGRLGVGRRTTWNYDDCLAITVTTNFEDSELSFASIKYAPKTKQQNKFFIKSWDSEFKTDKILPYTQFIVRREIASGRRVFKTWQTTNSYKIA